MARSDDPRWAVIGTVVRSRSTFSTPKGTSLGYADQLGKVSAGRHYIVVWHCETQNRFVKTILLEYGTTSYFVLSGFESQHDVFEFVEEK